MSEKSLTVTSRTATELLASGGAAEDKLRRMTRKLMRLTPGGKDLTMDQAAQLAVYCWMTDLNPFNNEAYWMDGVGPYPGVAGYRRKALEYLAITSSPDDRFYCDFRDAMPGEGNFDLDAGDIARHATLRIRSVSEKWNQNILRIYTQLTQAGMDTEKAWERAERLGGPEPVWTAVGVVDHREKFSRAAGTKGPNDPGTPDKWDKVQRAEKRAEKGAIRKAFASVLMPDVDMGEQASIDANIVDAIVRDVTEELAAKTPPRPEAEILAELGYIDTRAAEPAADEEQAEEPAPEPEPAEEPAAAQAPEHAPGKSWDGAFVKALMEERVAQHPKQAVAILNMLQPATLEDAVRLGKFYRGHRDAGKEKDEAAELAAQGVEP